MDPQILHSRLLVKRATTRERDASDLRRLLAAGAGVAALVAIEITVALFSGSLALLGEAGHLLTDTGSFAIAALAVRRSRLPAAGRRTFGHRRSGTLAAALNGLVLLAVAAGITVGAVVRLVHPPVVHPLAVIAVAALAVLADAGIALLLRGGGRGLGVRSALLHVAADGAGAAGVLLSSLVILATGWERADPAVSLLIALLVAAGAVRLLGEVRGILEEEAPGDLDPEQVRTAIQGYPGITGVHDLHIWSLDRGHRLLSAHVAVADRPMGEITAILRAVESRLCSDFGIEHATLQPESPACLPNPALFCDPDERHSLHDERRAGRGGTTVRP
jgi:cobalt-zinc-cadmium efflux system protein